MIKTRFGSENATAIVHSTAHNGPDDDRKKKQWCRCADATDPIMAHIIVVYQVFCFPPIGFRRFGARPELVAPAQT